MDKTEELKEIFNVDKFNGMDLTKETKGKILDAYISIMLDSRRGDNENEMVEK